ncbi:MAG: orotidine-5'-phosphate decarboxylase [Halieaceae bacterium]|jgi:orotidine-5'-phosphate decarboxylase
MPRLDPAVIVALDYAEEAPALALAQAIDPDSCRLKVGKELFTACGPALLDKLHTLGFDVFLDLKFHDIPNTVASALRAVAAQGVWMVNVHASGGRRMLEASVDALAGLPKGPRLIAVTVLTSMDQADFAELGYAESVEARVQRLALLTRDCGLDGVVCSAREASLLRRSCGPEFTLVTPGIRPAGSATDDQRRVLTPEQAIADGASYLVIGRPVTRAQDPAAALTAINASLSIIS